MELIDKNDVIKCINQCIREASDDLPSCDYYHGLMTAYAFFSQYVPQIPSVDAVPIKHGEWLCSELHGAIKMKCSECQTAYYSVFASYSNYCPNCGARMDGKEEKK